MLRQQKKSTTVRLDKDEYDKVKMLAKKTNKSESQVIRESLDIGITDLIDDMEEDELLRKRLAEKSPDIDGESFINKLKEEFGV